MIYPADETGIKKDNTIFFITVIVYPLAMIAVFTGTIYLLALNHHVPARLSFLLYPLILYPAFFVHKSNRRKWVKMPDGNWKRKDAILNTPVSPQQSEAFDIEYYHSPSEKMNTIIAGAFFIIAGIYTFITSENYKQRLISFFISGAGLFIVLKKIITQPAKKPCLRLSKKGIWTNKTGFIDWNNIDRIEIQEFPEDEKPDIRLDFYFKHAVFEKTTGPGQMVLLSLDEDKGVLELAISHLMSKRNEVSG